MTRRAFLFAGLGLVPLLGCRNGGNFSLGGYTTEPPYDPNIRSVYIPVFKVSPILTSPYRTIDVDLTDAVVKELNARKSPIKVISDPGRADTELIGNIFNITKPVLNRNNQNLPLESEVQLTIDILWRDLRTGNMLSNPKYPKVMPGPGPRFDPNIEKPPPEDPNPPGLDKPLPVRIMASGRFITQNGETTATGMDAACKKAAEYIVNMMEKPWDNKK